jgi:ABC-type phosphate transport system substrate-binding protein
LETYTYHPFFLSPGEKMKKLTIAILITLLMGSIFTSAAFAQNVRVSGSTTVFPLAQAAAEAFKRCRRTTQFLSALEAPA